MPVRAVAERAVDEIIADLCGRAGLDAEWHGIDAVIREEIRQEWIRIAEVRIQKAREEVS